MTNAVEIRGLHYRAGKNFEIGNLDLTVPAGSIYGFLGPNGSGKTTTIRLILGLLRARAGSICVLEEPMPERAPAVLARIGFVPEQPHLDPTLTVCETMRFREAFYPTWDGDWAGRLLRTFDLDPHHPFGKLSKGQKGKVMMLLALAQRPELLVLDEPTEGLDPNQRLEIRHLIADLGKERTVLLSTHVLSEVRQSCSRLLIINKGRIVADGAVDTLVQRAEGGRQVRVEAKGDRVLERLGAVAGVARVQPDGGTAGVRAVVTVSGEADVRPAIFELAKREGWTLYELHEEQGNLEDLFRQLTTETGAEAAS